MKKLYGILFFLLAGAMVSVGFAAVPTTADGVEVIFDRADHDAAFLMEYLRELDRQIVNLFRTRGRRGKIPCRIVLDSHDTSAVELSLRREEGALVLVFNDRAARFYENFPLRRRLTGALLLAKAGVEPSPGALDSFPAWIACGIDNRIAERLTHARILRSNRYFPCLRYCAAVEKFPDFNRMRTLDADAFSPGVLRWFGEAGRVLLDYGNIVSSDSSNALLDYVLLKCRADVLEKEAFDGTLGRAILRNQGGAGTTAAGTSLAPREDASARIQRILETYARTMAWNDFSPRPPYLTRRMLDRFYAVRAPVCKPDGTPEPGKFRVEHITRLPVFLKDRRDGFEIRAGLLRDLTELSRGTGRELGGKLYQLYLALAALPIGNSSDAIPIERFYRAIVEVDKTLNFQMETERFLDTVAAGKGNSPDPLEPVLREAAESGEILGEGGKKFVEEAMKSYLED